MEVHCLEIESYTIEFGLVYRPGAELVVIFHGYGQDIGDMQEAAECFIKQGYSVLVPHLFFHGRSIPKKHLTIPVSTIEWADTLFKLLAKFQHSKLLLFGFSMGARFVLSFYKHYPECVHRIYLLAPDGLKRNPWNILGTSTVIGRQLFSYFMNKPQGLMRLSKLLSTMKMLNKSRRKFVDSYLTQEQERNRVLNTWLVFRKLRLKPDLLAQLSKQNGTEIQFYYGAHDRVITKDSFPGQLNNILNIRLKVLNCGHSKLVHQALVDIQSTKFCENK